MAGWWLLVGDRHGQALGCYDRSAARGAHGSFGGWELRGDSYLTRWRPLAFIAVGDGRVKLWDTNIWNERGAGFYGIIAAEVRHFLL